MQYKATTLQKKLIAHISRTASISRIGTCSFHIFFSWAALCDDLKNKNFALLLQNTAQTYHVCIYLAKRIPIFKANT